MSLLRAKLSCLLVLTAITPALAANQFAACGFETSANPKYPGCIAAKRADGYLVGKIMPNNDFALLMTGGDCAKVVLTTKTSRDGRNNVKMIGDLKCDLKSKKLLFNGQSIPLY